jgi:septal ring factor EnvC (AmiA/AmiB activator)
MYVADIAFLTWEILRLRRCRAVLINLKFHDALKEVLRGLSDIGSEIYEAAEGLSHDWFTDSDARKQVLQVLKQFHLDESAIEAEAIRESAEDLELLDRLLASLESRRNKALRCIAEYRGGFAKQLRTSYGIIDGKVLAVEEATDNKPSVAARR